MSFRLLLTAVLTAGLASAGQAGTIYVDDDNCPGPGDGSDLNPYCSIQTAIDNAVDTDEIIVRPGTYVEAINLLGKAVHLHSANGAGATTIEAPDPNTMAGGAVGLSAVSCVFGEGPSTVIEGFTITGGTGTPDGQYTDGGGMFVNNSSPTVRHCRFINNIANTGGGLAIQDGASLIADCLFEGNLGSVGHGLHAYSPFTDVGPTIVRCVFRNNGSPLRIGLGGGMAVHEPATVVNCWFSGNHSDKGAGIFTSGAVTVTNCVFANNDGNRGGGLRAINGEVRVGNCTFVQNVAPYGGGGIYVDHEGPLFANCIVWGNEPDQVSGDASAGAVISSNVQGGWPGVGNIDANPQFVDPESGDYRLSPGSPCIDAGDNTAVPEGIRRDLAGNPRIAVGSRLIYLGSAPVVDMGAYEYQFNPFDQMLPGAFRPSDAADLAIYLGLRR